MKRRLQSYFDTLATVIQQIEATDQSGNAMPLEDAIGRLCSDAHAAHNRSNKIMFIGNGGSAGIASHLAIDFSKNGRLRSLAFNDPSALTCLGNDLGYENIFAKQIDMHARPGDLLVAISSSGRSPNILAATAMARLRECRIITLSGFDADNDLRRKGDVNFYVNAHAYGFVEIAHLAICHAALDIDMGWGLSDAITWTSLGKSTSWDGLFP